MANNNQPGGTFEERLNALEALVKQMEAGGMPLEDAVKAYEQGAKLAQSLKKDLSAAQERLTVLKPCGEDAEGT